ncbi:MAG: hypothetical protein WCY29_18065, partial [Novosphingobium sp.]
PATAPSPTPSTTAVQVPTPPSQAAKTSPPRQIPAAPGFGSASSGRESQRPARESAQPPRGRPGADAEIARRRAAAAAVAPRTDAQRSYVRPTLIALATMVAIALGISAYRGADEPSPTVAERSVGPDAGDGAAQVQGPDRPVESAAANTAGAGDPDPSGVDLASSAMTTAPAGAVPGETPADAAADFAQLSSNEVLAAEKHPSTPDRSASGVADAPAETGDRPQTREPGSAARAPAESPAAIAEVRPPAPAADPADSGSGSASAAPAVASLSKPDPAPKAAAVSRPKAASAARRPAPSAVGKPNTPAPAELARLYAVRADYELNRDRPREALISVAHGLAAVPDDRKLRQLRSRALEQLRVRAAH